ncbi:MAG: hypothetical protein EBY22_10580 [Gammaproteobacteria bacterium]|nr:hypothetical protein [Gammaproteobacteria bacterium]
MSFEFGKMKREVVTYKVERPKTRAHFVLFADDSPFKAKAVKRKDMYRRKPKHKSSYLES